MVRFITLRIIFSIFCNLIFQLGWQETLRALEKGGGKIFAADFENYRRLGSRYGPLDGLFSEVSTPATIDCD